MIVNLITDNNTTPLSLLLIPGIVQDVPQPMTEEEERNTKRKLQ